MVVITFGGERARFSLFIASLVGTAPQTPQSTHGSGAGGARLEQHHQLRDEDEQGALPKRLRLVGAAVSEGLLSRARPAQ